VTVRRATVIVSLVIHAGVAVSLMGAATQGERRKAISVAVADASKKKKAEPPKPPPAPRPIARHAPKVVATAAKPAAVIEAPRPAARAAVATALAMSNDDAPGGIALASAGGGGAPSGAGSAPQRVASAVSSARTRRAREALGGGNAGTGAGEAGGGGDAPCAEEPSKPVPVFKADLEYTVAAKTEGIEGKLKLKLTVAADGSVSDVEVLASVEPALDAVAVAAARQWRFTPALRCGRPVAGGSYVLQKRYELTD
jgi:periplasmic protein TonB